MMTISIPSLHTRICEYVFDSTNDVLFRLFADTFRRNRCDKVLYATVSGNAQRSIPVRADCRYTQFPRFGTLTTVRLRICLEKE